MESWLTTVVLWISLALSTTVAVSLLISVANHRMAASREMQFHSNLLADLAWNLIPIVIVISMAAPALVQS